MESGRRPDYSVVESGRRPDYSVVESGRRPDYSVVESGRRPDYSVVESGRRPDSRSREPMFKHGEQPFTCFGNVAPCCPSSFGCMNECLHCLAI